MSSFNYAQWKEAWNLLTDKQRDRIKAKAAWEHMSLSAITHEWSDLIPKRLQKRFAACFKETA